MIKETFDIGEETVMTMRPDDLAGQFPVIWLIAPAGEAACSWVEKTKVSSYAETSKAMLLCLPGGRDRGFYAEKVWNEIKERYPDAGGGRKDRRLIGLGDSAILSLDLVFLYPEKFFIAVAVCPEDESNAEEMIEHARQYSEGGGDIPRMVIADSAEGQGRAIGDAVNEYGFGMHVHSTRPCSGWDLADLEVSNCLAHL